MRKILLFMVLSMAWSVQALAEKVSAEKAYAVAQNFFAGKRSSAVLSGDVVQAVCASEAYYVFQRGTNGGYVVVAADDERFGTAVLGYSDCGSFDANDLPEALRWLLSAYDCALTSGDVHAPLAQTDFADIEPLLTSRWGQDAPYNGECPVVDGVQAPTGCVATALSQIIYYNKYPSVGYEGHAYDYAAMSDTYSAASTAEAKAAVAQLMHDVGLACNMNYGATVSGAVNIDGARAMANHFGYDKSAILLSRDFYTAKEWTEMLYNSLANGVPVFYAGLNARAGHAFVCDGYRDGYFHFNWGWEGLSDGYFQLDALNPKAQGTGGSSEGYNLQQEAIFNLKPAEAESGYASLMYCYTDFDVTEREHAFTSTAVFTGSFLNYSLVAKDVSLGLKVVGTDNGVTWLRSDYTATLNTYDGPTQFEVSMAEFPATAGQYAVYPAYLDNATGVWQEMRVNTTLKKTHLIATVEGNKVRFANSSDDNVPQLDFSAWTTSPAPGVAGRKLVVSVDVTNNGLAYDGEIRFVMTDYRTGETAAVSSTVDLALASGDVENVEFELVAPATAGMYKCFVYDSKDRRLNSVPPYLSIADAPIEPELVLNLSALTASEEGDVALDRMSFTAVIDCESGTYEGGNLELRIMNEAGSEVLASCSKVFSIEAGETKSVAFSGPFNGLEEGKTYLAALFYETDGEWLQLGESMRFTTAVANGIEAISAATLSTPLTVYNLMGVKVLSLEGGESFDSATLSPGIYILRSGNAVRRIVVGR